MSDINFTDSSVKFDDFCEGHVKPEHTGLVDVATRFKGPFIEGMSYSDYDEVPMCSVLDADGNLFVFAGCTEADWYINDLHKIAKLIAERDNARKAVGVCIEELHVHAQNYVDSPMHEVIRQAKKLIGE